jgi:hypothetical protein
MPLGPEDLRFAADDARRRHTAVVDLILANDRHVLGFLQLYVALAGGALSGAAAILLSSASSFPRALGFGLLGFAVPIAIGAVMCMAIIWASNINLPGRKPDFWLWATDETPERVYTAYLKNLEIKEAANSELNTKLSRWTTIAKALGVAAPITAIAVGAAAVSFGF